MLSESCGTRPIRYLSPSRASANLQPGGEVRWGERARAAAAGDNLEVIAFHRQEGRSDGHRQRAVERRVSADSKLADLVRVAACQFDVERPGRRLSIVSIDLASTS